MSFDVTTLTLMHTVISIVAIAAGLVVVGGLIAEVVVTAKQATVPTAAAPG